ncbi:MAG: hypothetical protein H8E12_16960 [Rhodobacteraceae bacterium]|nr:hypothetical protein [Paracoccaceae bacterium]
MSLTGFKNSIYRHGIHSLTGLSIGEEQILKSTSEIELTAVPISFSYMMEKDISTSFKTADISLTYYPEEGREAELFESIHFTLTSGTRVDTLFTPAETSDLLVTYTDNDSGQIRTLVDLVGAIDGSNTQFVLPNNESAFGYFKTFSGIDFTFSGVGSIFNELPEGGE